jgi:hypothetical protein
MMLIITFLFFLLKFIKKSFQGRQKSGSNDNVEKSRKSSKITQQSAKTSQQFSSKFEGNNTPTQQVIIPDIISSRLE